MSDHGQSAPSSGPQFAFLQVGATISANLSFQGLLGGRGNGARENMPETGQQQRNTRPQVAA